MDDKPTPPQTSFGPFGAQKSSSFGSSPVQPYAMNSKSTPTTSASSQVRAFTTPPSSPKPSTAAPLPSSASSGPSKPKFGFLFPESSTTTEQPTFGASQSSNASSPSTPSQGGAKYNNTVFPHSMSEFSWTSTHPFASPAPTATTKFTPPPKASAASPSTTSSPTAPSSSASFGSSGLLAGSPSAAPATTAPRRFVKPASTTSSPPRAPIFANNPPTHVFPFGSSAAAGTAPSESKPSTGSTTASSSGGLFGSASTSDGLFGSTASSSSSGLFKSTAAPSGGLFGSTSTSGGLFGSAAPSGGLFGSTTSSSSSGPFSFTAAPSGGPFGSASTSGGLFGSAAPSGGLFGSTASPPGTPSASGGLFSFTSTSTKAAAKAPSLPPNIIPWDWTPQSGAQRALQSSEMEQASKQPQASEERAKAILSLSAAHSQRMLPLPAPYLQPIHTATKLRLSDELTVTNFIDRSEPADDRSIQLATQPIGQLAFNSLGDLFMTLPTLHHIVQFQADGSRVRVIDGLPGFHNHVREPTGLAIDFENQLFFCNPKGQITTYDLAHSRGKWLNNFTKSTVTCDGPLHSAQFCSPKQLEFAKNGDLLVLDSAHRALRLIRSSLLVPASIDTAAVDLAGHHTSHIQERRNIAARNGIGHITTHSLVFTLSRLDPITHTPSFRIMSNGGVFFLSPYSTFIITRDGVASYTGLSGEGAHDIHFETENGFAAMLGRTGDFGLYSLDPHTGMVDAAQSKTIKCIEPLTPQDLGVGGGFGNAVDEGRTGILPLPDRTGYMVANTSWKSVNLTIVTAERYGPRFTTPPHCARPFNLSTLLRSERSSPSMKPSSTFLAFIQGASFPIYDIVLQKRCPALLDTTVQQRLSQLNLNNQAFEDLFYFIYDDCLAPLSNNRTDSALRFLDLHLIASICQLHALADFAQSRCQGLLQAMPVIPGASLFKPIIQRYTPELLQQHPLALSLVRSFSVYDYATAEGYFKAISDEFPDFHTKLDRPLPMLNATDPFGRLGECFIDLCPSFGTSMPKSGYTEGDFDFVLGSESLRVHSLILAARWPFFAQMLDSGLGEAANKRWTIEFDWTPAGLRGFLRYLYTGYLDQLNDRRTCFDIHCRAEFLGLDANSFEHEGLFHHCAKIARLLTLQEEHFFKEPAPMEKETVIVELEWLCKVFQEGDPSQVESAQALLAPRIPEILANKKNLEAFEQLPVSIRVGVLVRHHTLTQASLSSPAHADPSSSMVEA